MHIDWAIEIIKGTSLRADSENELEDIFLFEDAAKFLMQQFEKVQKQLNDLMENHDLRLKRYIANPQVAKGMDEKVAMGVQHGRTTELKLCQEELKDIINGSHNNAKN